MKVSVAFEGLFARMRGSVGRVGWGGGGLLYWGHG